MLPAQVFPRDPLGPQSCVVRHIRPTLSTMAWGDYGIALAHASEGKSAKPAGVIIFPSGVGREEVFAALGDKVSRHDVGCYFCGKYQYASETPGRYVFEPRSVCIRVEASARELLELAQALVAMTRVGTALVISEGSSDFYVIECPVKKN